MKINIIAAVARNRAIGKGNKLIYRLPNDLKRFKALTTGHTIIMGRNTWLSLPVRPLKNRRNIVISRTMPEGDGYEIARSPEEALALCPAHDTTYIMGGGAVYREMMPFAGELIVTRVMKSFDADTFFPDISPDEWEIKEESETLHDNKSGLDYRYETYRRINTRPTTERAG